MMTFENHIQKAEQAFMRGAATYQIDARAHNIEYVHQELRRAGRRANKDWKYGKWRSAVIIKPRRSKT